MKCSIGFQGQGGGVFQMCSPIIHWSWGHTDRGNSDRPTSGDFSVYRQYAESAPASSWTLLRRNHSPVGKGTVTGYNWVVFLGYSTFLLDHKPHLATYQLPTGRESPFAVSPPPKKPHVCIKTWTSEHQRFWREGSSKKGQNFVSTFL